MNVQIPLNFIGVYGKNSFHYTDGDDFNDDDDDGNDFNDIWVFFNV